MNKVNKTLLNKAYRTGNRILHATYHGEIWTSNAYIAERGKIEPRIYKDQLDQRDRTDKIGRPELEPIIDNTVGGKEKIVACVDSVDTSLITTDEKAYYYNTDLVNYFIAKYGLNNILLQPQDKTSMLFAMDNDNVVAVLAGRLS